MQVTTKWTAALVELALQSTAVSDMCRLFCLVQSRRRNKVWLARKKAVRAGSK